MAYLDSDKTYTVVRMKRITLQAQGAAGVYTGSVTVDEGATLLDIHVHGVALWTAGTAATLIVGDAADPNGYFAGVNAKATDLLAGQSLSFSEAGGKAGAYIAGDQVNPRYSATERTITAEMTTTGTASSVGTTYVDVFFAVPSAATTTAASYVAS